MCAMAMGFLRSIVATKHAQLRTYEHEHVRGDLPHRLLAPGDAGPLLARNETTGPVRCS
jgi:hypothetical protein